jgi:hypothetical protein
LTFVGVTPTPERPTSSSPPPFTVPPKTDDSTPSTLDHNPQHSTPPPSTPCNGKLAPPLANSPPASVPFHLDSSFPSPAPKPQAPSDNQTEAEVEADNSMSLRPEPPPQMLGDTTLPTSPEKASSTSSVCPARSASTSIPSVSSTAARESPVSSVRPANVSPTSARPAPVLRRQVDRFRQRQLLEGKAQSTPFSFFSFRPELWKLIRLFPSSALGRVAISKRRRWSCRSLTPESLLLSKRLRLLERR